MNEKIKNIILHEDNTLKDAMERISKAGLRIITVIGQTGKLLGVATDGDIRKALLAGKDLGAPIQDIMTSNPITALENTPAVELMEIMLKKGVNEIPIVNERGGVEDIVLLSELKSIPLSSPDITGKEIEIINQVLGTPYLSIGPKIEAFEAKIADFVGAKYAVGVNSGTSGLHLCVRSLGIKDGDEVITTPFSFIASANCILFERAKPVFADIDENTLCLDPVKIEEKITSKTRAILPVHVFGHSCDMDKIIEIARKHNLAIIEDACEALGTQYNGKKVGSFGDCGVFAFYPNKQMTTAEGGLIVTDNEEIAKLCRSMRNQGRDENGGWLSHTRLGYNYRMNELSAAMGVAQMERIEELLHKRQNVARLYNERLRGIKGIKPLSVAPEVKMSWFVYVIRLDSQKFSCSDRDGIIQELKMKGISCSNYFPPLHLEPFYVQTLGCKRGDYPITEKVSGSTIALPFYNNLTDGQIDYIGDCLETIINKF